MKFLIQKIEKEIRHDFSFTLLESIRFNNWLHRNNDIKRKFINNNESDDINQIQFNPSHKNYIPIGSVEFVSKFLEYFYGTTPKPRNIPIELIPYAERTVINGTEKDINGEKFVKSNDKIKSFTNICDVAPQGNYQISDVVSFGSEWRGFVYRNKLVGLQNYAGDFTLFPRIKTIGYMIEDFSKSAPIAYTLDVGIMIPHEHTVIIEVHDFFSCGLYGFSYHKKLPYMFSDWFNEYLAKNGIGKYIY